MASLVFGSFQHIRFSGGYHYDQVLDWRANEDADPTVKSKVVHFEGKDPISFNGLVARITFELPF